MAPQSFGSGLHFRHVPSVMYGLDLHGRENRFSTYAFDWTYAMRELV